jgi:cytochrome b involved in lipid metabolism
MDNARRKEEKEEGAKKKEVKKEEVRIFTKAEVAKHDTVHDCWMIINGKVYDVTPFVDEHPGGDILMDVRCASSIAHACAIGRLIHLNRD